MTQTVFIPTKLLKPHPKNKEIYGDPEDIAFDNDIKQTGIRKDLIINGENVIFDGHRRWRRALKFGIQKVPCQIRDFTSISDELAIVLLNLHRNKTPREIYNDAKILKPILAPQAEKRMLEGTPVSNLTQGRVRDITAKTLKISSGQLHKLDKIFENEEEHPEIVGKVDSGEMSVHAGFEAIKNTAVESEENFAIRFTNTFNSHITQVVQKDLPVIVNHMDNEHNCGKCPMAKACSLLLDSFVRIQGQLPNCMKEKLDK